MDNARILLAEAKDYGLREYNPELVERIDAFLAQPDTPMVVVLRPSDGPNEFRVSDGNVEIYDIDCGAPELSDRGEFLGWAASLLEAAKDMAERRPEAARHICEIVWSYADLHHGFEFVGLTEDELIELAYGEGHT